MCAELHAFRVVRAILCAKFTACYRTVCYRCPPGTILQLPHNPRRVPFAAAPPQLPARFRRQIGGRISAINMPHAFPRVGVPLCLLLLAKFAPGEREHAERKRAEEMERHRREKDSRAKVGRAEGEEDERRGGEGG